MIYILRLESEKYYIGYTENISNRILSHFTNGGSSWTKKYKPIEIIDTFEGDKIKEKEITIQYMKKYGWENVRGAGWCAINQKKPLILE